MAAFSILFFVFASLVYQASCANLPGADVAIRTHNAPGTFDADTRLVIRQNMIALRKRQDQDGTYRKNMTLQTSWEDATLLFLAKENDNGTQPEPEVDIVCTKCYINAVATAELKFGPDSNINDVLQETVHQIDGVIGSVTKAVGNWIEEFTRETLEDFEQLDFTNFTYPPFNVSLDVEVDSNPNVTLHFGFEELEIFLQVRTMLATGSSFVVPLYDSSKVLGVLGVVEIGLGVFFTVDLILDVDRPLDMTSGVHLKLDDTLSITIDLFGKKPSEIDVNGGQFEFLPVTVGVDGAAFSAILRVGAHAGLKAGIDNNEYGAGMEVAVFADVAEIVTNITATPNDADCKLPMSQEYSIALGAAAGATVVVKSATYGPVAETFTPIWYTTMTGLCASEAETTATSIPTLTSQTLGERDDLETTVVTTEVKQTGIGCPQSLGPNCPISLRTTTQYTQTQSLTTAIPWGADATFPTAIHDTITSMAAFGSNAQKIASSSGSPTSYVEPPPTSTSNSASSTGKDSKESSAAAGNAALSVSTGLFILVSVALAAL